MKKSKHIFISYSTENRKTVERLRDQLLAAGERVWWDEDILGGRDWEEKIERAIKDAYAVIACFSADYKKGNQSGMKPELYDAIDIQRKTHRPFIIPVRLDPCKIPDIKIYAGKNLTKLQHIDLFPDNKWSENFTSPGRASRQS